MSFGGDLQGFGRKTGITLDKIVRKTVIDMTRAIVVATPVDTGMARANWFWGTNRDGSIDTSNEYTSTLSGALKQFSGSFGVGPMTRQDHDALAAMRFVTGRKTNKQAYASAKSALAKDQSGKASISRSVAFAGTIKGGGVFYLTNNLPYIMALEYGHSKQAPQGMARITVARFQNIVNEAVRLCS